MVMYALRAPIPRFAMGTDAFGTQGGGYGVRGEEASPYQGQRSPFAPPPMYAPNPGSTKNEGRGGAPLPGGMAMGPGSPGYEHYLPPQPPAPGGNGVMYQGPPIWANQMAGSPSPANPPVNPAPDTKDVLGPQSYVPPPPVPMIDYGGYAGHGPMPTGTPAPAMPPAPAPMPPSGWAGMPQVPNSLYGNDGSYQNSFGYQPGGTWQATGNPFESRYVNPQMAAPAPDGSQGAFGPNGQWMYGDLPWGPGSAPTVGPAPAVPGGQPAPGGAPMPGGAPAPGGALPGGQPQPGGAPGGAPAPAPPGMYPGSGGYGLPSYGPEVWQNNPSLRYLTGGMSYGDYLRGNANATTGGALGVTLPSLNSLNYNSLSNIYNAGGMPLLGSEFGSQNRDLAVEMALAGMRAPLGSAINTGLINTGF